MNLTHEVTDEKVCTDVFTSKSSIKRVTLKSGLTRGELVRIPRRKGTGDRYLPQSVKVIHRETIVPFVSESFFTSSQGVRDPRLLIYVAT